MKIHKVLCNECKMVLLFWIILLFGTKAISDTGSGVKISQTSCTIPVDIISEIQTLRSLLHQESKITLELSKQVVDLQKDFHQLRSQYTSSLQENQNMAMVIDSLRYNISVLESESSALGKSQEVTSAAILDLTSVVQQKMTGAIFIRWGQTACPANTSELVYSGMKYFIISLST